MDRWILNAWHDGRIMDTNGKRIASCSTQTDAARIVACVNGWDALQAERDALRAALESIVSASTGTFHYGSKASAELAAIARAALAGKGGAS